MKALREAAEKVQKHGQDAPTGAAQAPAGKDVVAGKEQIGEAATSFSEEDTAQSKVMLALGALVSSEPAAGMQVGAASAIKDVSDTTRNSHLRFYRRLYRKEKLADPPIKVVLVLMLSIYRK